MWLSGNYTQRYNGMPLSYPFLLRTSGILQDVRIHERDHSAPPFINQARLPVCWLRVILTCTRTTNPSWRHQEPLWLKELCNHLGLSLGHLLGTDAVLSVVNHVAM